MQDRDGISIRRLASSGDYAAALALQDETWGHGFSDRVPAMMMKVANGMGGLAAGAFDDDGALLGFVFGISGFREGGPAHWSDMCAVAALARDRGIGRRLKLFQREAMLELGIPRVYWTFDPLVARNAWFNLGRLGAEPAEYVDEMYPDSDSPRHRALGTDRFIVRWDLGPDPDSRARPATEDLPEIVDAGDGLPAAFALRVPADAFALAGADPAAARELRRRTREVFRAALAGGWRIRDFVRDPGGGGRYVVTREEPDA
ncbi:MAG: GNAT family N-acetyltransferase [Planctomycetota bacterium]